MHMQIPYFVTVVSVTLCCSTMYLAASNCPSLDNADELSQSQLFTRLSHGCRYDRLERPVVHTESGERLPLDVYARVYIYFMRNLEAHDLQFKIHALIQFRFVDSRLSFRKISAKRSQPIMGEQKLRDMLWMPHIFLANERDSQILGTSEKDILTSISPDGTVIVSSRIQATLHCWLNLKKFPFDEQHCSMILESWMYNTSELVLHWEHLRPITYDSALHLTEFTLRNIQSKAAIINADLNDLRHGAFAGNYSSLSFTVHLTRVVGFYLMDYFLPSMLIVGISWVSFWLQADQAAPRITLGTSTMLTFITLASAQGKTLPKVSYIKVSEVWFLGCTIFIFGSLLEFAFVNCIWRQKRNFDVKKMNSKHILKSTLPPQRHVKSRSKSFSGQGLINVLSTAESLPHNNYLTVNLPISTKAAIVDEQRKEATKKRKVVTATGKKFEVTFVESGLLGHDDESNKQSPIHKHELPDPHTGWTTLTPQEIAIWIDSKARWFFPLCFLVFNIFFWLFVYVV